MSQSIKKYQPTKHYFIAAPSFWPIIGSCGLFTTVLGLVQTLHEGVLGPYSVSYTHLTLPTIYSV